MRAAISGTVVSDDTGQNIDLEVLARDVALDEDLLSALPEGLSLADRLQPVGSFDVAISSLKIVRVAPSSAETEGADVAEAPAEDDPSAREVTWRAEGLLRFKEVQADIGLGQKVLSGTLDGVVAGLPEGLGINAQASLDSIQIAGRELTDVTGHVFKHTESNILHIRDLLGDSHGGRAVGFAEIRLADPVEYGVQLSVENIDLTDLFNAGIEDPEERSNVRGRLAGTIQLVATSDDPDSRRASGVLQISEAQMYKLPVILGLMNVMFLTIPSESAFSDGAMTYRMEGQRLIFDEIHLMGESLSMIGSGTIDLDSQTVNFTFLAGPPNTLPRLEHFSDFLDHVIGELVEIRVTGPMSDPQTRTVALRSLEAALSTLLQPERGSE